MNTALPTPGCSRICYYRQTGTALNHLGKHAVECKLTGLRGRGRRYPWARPFCWKDRRQKALATHQSLVSPASAEKERQIQEGTVIMAPLQAPDIPGAAVLLSRAFAGSPEALTFNDISKYYTKMLRANDWSAGLVLVARLIPNGGACMLCICSTSPGVSVIATRLLLV